MIKIFNAQKYKVLKNKINRGAALFSVMLVFAAALTILFYSWRGVVDNWANATSNQTLANKTNPDSIATLESTRVDATGMPRYDRPETGVYHTQPKNVGGAQFQVFPVRGTITDSYGIRSNPFAAFGLPEFHAGLDIGAPLGTPVFAAANGVVTFAGWDGGYGNVVMIEHGNSRVSTRYGHLSQLNVTTGQVVTSGMQIGAVGSTGRSTGPHLHYEVRVNGSAIDPLSIYSFK